MRVFISAVDPSGDEYAAILGQVLAEAGGARVLAVGGDAVERAGFEVLEKLSSFSAVGLWEALSSLPRFVRSFSRVVDGVRSFGPRAVVLVDGPEFNLRLFRALVGKLRGVKFFYLAPPAVWAWRRGRIRALREMDGVFPLFPFEHRLLSQEGVKSFYFGHPLRDVLSAFEPDGSTVEILRGLRRSGKKLVGFFPGSRRSEVERLLPAMLESARSLRDRFDVVFSIFDGLPRESRERARRALEKEGFEHVRGAREILSFCDAGVAASGTIAVEAVWYGTPLAVGYRVSPLSALAFKLLVRTRFVAMPNVLLGEEVFPELLQRDFNPRRIARALDSLLGDKGDWVRERISALREELFPKTSVLRRVSEVVLG